MHATPLDAASRSHLAAPGRLEIARPPPFPLPLMQMQKHPGNQPSRASAWQADMLSAIANIARGIARRHVPPEVAEDIAQDIVLGFVVRLDAGRLREPPMYLYALVRRIVLRRVIDLDRKHSAERESEESYARQIDAAIREWMRPDVVIELNEIKALETEALEEMSPDSREVFVLIREGSTSYKAAGELLGLTPMAICGHVVAAHRALRSVFEQRGILVARSERRRS